MHREPVVSSNLAAVGYNADDLLLEVQFLDREGKAGAVYEYRQVPPQVHRALMQAESKGQFFNAQIKDRYPFRKVAPAAKP